MSRALLWLGAVGGFLALHLKRSSEAQRKQAERQAEIDAGNPPTPAASAKPPTATPARPPTLHSAYPPGFPIPRTTAVVKKPFQTSQAAEAVLRGLGMRPVPLTTGRVPQNDNWARDMAIRAGAERNKAAANAMIVQADGLPQIAFLADLGTTTMWVMPLV